MIELNIIQLEEHILIGRDKYFFRLKTYYGYYKDLFKASEKGYYEANEKGIILTDKYIKKEES